MAFTREAVNHLADAVGFQSHFTKDTPGYAAFLFNKPDQKVLSPD
jgi:hypothetical protein